MELRARREREVLPVVVAGLQIVVVDRDDVVAFLDLQVVVIGRAVLVDVADLVEAGRVGDEVEARIARLLRRARPAAGPPLTPVCDALSWPIIIIMTVCSSSSSTR